MLQSCLSSHSHCCCHCHLWLLHHSHVWLCTICCNVLTEVSDQRLTLHGTKNICSCFSDHTYSRLFVCAGLKKRRKPCHQNPHHHYTCIIIIWTHDSNWDEWESSWNHIWTSGRLSDLPPLCCSPQLIVTIRKIRKSVTVSMVIQWCARVLFRAFGIFGHFTPSVSLDRNWFRNYSSQHVTKGVLT